MMKKANQAMTWSWSILARWGKPTVKALSSTWNALVRPLLEYGSEIWPGEIDYVCQEAERLQLRMARRDPEIKNKCLLVRLWVSQVT